VRSSVMGFVVRTGSRPDAPFPIMLGALGFVAAVAFSGVLSSSRAVAGSIRCPSHALQHGEQAWGSRSPRLFFLAVSRGDPAFLRLLRGSGPRRRRCCRGPVRWFVGVGQKDARPASCSRRRRTGPRWGFAKESRESRCETAADRCGVNQANGEQALNPKLAAA
jgi:hypothetical protein